MGGTVSVSTKNDTANAPATPPSSPTPATAAPDHQRRRAAGCAVAAVPHRRAADHALL